LEEKVMKFLVVDDSATMRRMVINSLQRIGLTETVEAGDGIEALNPFDASIGFVITDWTCRT
jgi:two-component system, chemotaxis family, chemotaxis protein CheY